MIALDFQTGSIRSLRVVRTRLVARSSQLCCIVLDDTRETRDTLARLEVSYSICEDGLVVIGEPAARYATMFRAKLRELLPGGLLPADDPPMRQVLGAVVDAVLPKLFDGETPAESRSLKSCCVARPAESSHRHPTIGHRAEHTLRWLTQLARLRGYELRYLSSGHALVLAEQVASSFTGLGVHIGRYCSSASLVIQGQLCADWSIEMGAFRRADHGDTLPDNEPSQRSIAETITRFVDALHEQMSWTAIHSQTIPQPIPVVIAGEIPNQPDVLALWHAAARGHRFPIDLGDARLIADPYAICRGCLIHDRLEDGVSDQQIAA